MSTTQAPLLWVPHKTTSDVSYAPSLRQTIAQTYQESADSYKEEIASLDRCRQDALRGSAGSDVTGRDLLYKYFGQLELLELRFPEVRVPFPWKDAFTAKEISQLSLAYEKASVIFNIAATLSSLAAQQNRTSTEGIRRAFHNFRCAAGMFTYINDNFLHAPSTDLSREVVKVLVQIMIAQATEVFVERMTEEKEKKPFGLRARVSTQAAFLYGSILEDVKELANKGIFERSWTWLVQCKHKYFISLAQYQRSLADSASSKHGDALTRLQLAETAAKDASRYATSFSTAFTSSTSASLTLPSDAAVSLLEITKTHLALCVEAKAAEQRDNDLIYHDAQPSEAALPPIEKSSVGEPIAIQEVYAAPEVQRVVGQDIFVRLVPLSVHQSSSLYSEEKAKLVRKEGERCDTADTELSTALEFMGLPASLDRFNDFLDSTGRLGRLDKLTQPPPPVIEWADAIQQARDIHPIEKMWDELLRLRDKTNRDIVNIMASLDADARECEQMRVKYDHLWDQQPNSNLTKTWRQSLKSHREALEAARQSDNQVDEIWQGAKADLQILADQSEVSLKRMFEEISSTQDDASKATNLLDLVDTNDDEAELAQMRNMVTAIQENISRLQAIKKEREGVFKDLKERIQADDISQLLILNRKAQNIEPALFAAELDKFRAHSGRISATLHLQATAIQELTGHFKSLVESKRGKELQDYWNNAFKKRGQLTARLQAAYQAHEEVRTGLSKGIQFYNEVQGSIGEIEKQVDTFIQNRTTERIRLVAKVESLKPLELQMGTLNLTDSSISSKQPSASIPPPLPPQPRQWQSTSISNLSGPPFHSFHPYPPPSEHSQTRSPQLTYNSPPPSVDPYASLGSLGTMLPAAKVAPHPAHVPETYPSHGQAQSAISQQYAGPAQSTPPAFPPYSVQTQPPPPASQSYSAQVPSSPTSPSYSGQPQLNHPSVNQQYFGQAQPPALVPHQYLGLTYSQYGSHMGSTTSSSSPAPIVPSKPVLPPPPPPVTYQSPVPQSYNVNSAYASSTSSTILNHHPNSLPLTNPRLQQYTGSIQPQMQPSMALAHQQQQDRNQLAPQPLQQYLPPPPSTHHARPDQQVTSANHYPPQPPPQAVPTYYSGHSSAPPPLVHAESGSIPHGGWKQVHLTNTSIPPAVPHLQQLNPPPHPKPGY
ncbi:hypothetical protein O181_064878 [Austropuccinia psidii MF-1]|uniref:BRO domain-containing protein 1 n=1 Tax=Austropuccinia psidii MF-1 TaxID=1389203 RepID=A0A9Q3EUD8_9BASI|nr:hypothetical protein [Austropuccinia psidii MF-1]